MEHPLLALAAAYDRAVPPLYGRSPLVELMEPWLNYQRPDEPLCHYAAHFSVLTQAYQLGDHGVLEEPQTDALYGLLASSFWHARVLDDAYRAFTGAPELHEDETPRQRYWLHQSKTQEAESGVDFGIVTSCDDDHVKVTLFQAKRPAKKQNPKTLSLDHMVRKDGKKLRENKAELDAALREVEWQIELEKQKKDAEDKQARDRLEDLLEKQKKLQDEDAEWEDHAGPRAQREAISRIRSYLEEGCNADHVMHFFNDDADLAKNISLRDADSLFRYPYSYPQCDAFLGTAIRGWRWPDAQRLPEGWCHYAQWVNRSAGEPWSVRLEQAFALLNNKHDDNCRRSFAEILAAALSSEDRTVGLIIPGAGLDDLTRAIKDDLPELVWGSVAERPEIARNLLLQCGVHETEIVPDISQPYPRAVARVQQPDNDLGNTNPKPDPFGRSR